MSRGRSPHVMIIGPGWRFTSGVSYFTCRLANALSDAMTTDALLMRQLLPTVFYPGRRRVGSPVNEVDYDRDVELFDGVDWWWGGSMRGAEEFLATRRPDVVVLQWWTGAVLHSYLRLARTARRHGARVVMEWHEVQDTGEARIPGVRRYVHRLMRRLLSRVDAHVVHSGFDLEQLRQTFGAGFDAPATVVPHGPYDHVRSADRPAADPDEERAFRLLFFGVIRPYKGLEHLVAAFEALPDDVRDRMSLTIVGETWEGWDAPLDAVAASPVRGSITVVNRYVTDAEAQRHFAESDAVVLPYLRSSASGPLHMAMSAGLPVVVSAVGGLVEAADGYDGARFVPPADVPALTTALAELPAARGRRYADPRSWESTVGSYERIFADLIGATVPTTVPAARPAPQPIPDHGKDDQR